MKLENTRHFDKNKTLAVSFQNVIHSYVYSIHNSSIKYHKALKGGLDISLRIITGSHASFVSKKVLEHLNANQIDINPFELIWEQRNLMGQVLIKNRKYSMAVWEHTVPIKEFRENLISLKEKSSIIKAIYEYPGVAWISREEDITLSRLGFQTKRPGGFLKCYKQAGIILFNEHEYLNK